MTVASLAEDIYNYLIAKAKADLDPWTYEATIPGTCVEVIAASRAAIMEHEGGLQLAWPIGRYDPTVGRRYDCHTTLSGHRWVKANFAAAIRAAWWHLRARTTSLRGSMAANHWEAGIGERVMVVETDTDFGGSGDLIFEVLTQDGADISGTYVGPGADPGNLGDQEYFAHICPSATAGIYYLVGTRYDGTTGFLAECNLYRNSAGAPATFTLLGDIPLPNLGREFVEFRTIAGDPNDIDTVYVGSVDQTNALGTTFAPAIIKSTDAGANWTRLADPFTDASGTFQINIIGPMGNGNLIVHDYAESYDTFGFGYSVSDDDGATWTRTAPSTNPTPPTLSPALTWFRGDYADGTSDALFPVALDTTMAAGAYDAVGNAYDHYFDFRYATATDALPAAIIGPNVVDQHGPDAETPATVLTTITVGADIQDYNPAGYTASITRLNLSSGVPVNFGGLTGGTNGRLIVLLNIGTQDISVTYQDPASTRGNRFYFLTGLGNPPIVLSPGESMIATYDSSYDDGFGVIGAWFTGAQAVFVTYGYNGGLWYLDPSAGVEVP